MLRLTHITQIPVLVKTYFLFNKGGEKISEFNLSLMNLDS